MYTWIFNISLQGVVRQMYERAMRRGVKLRGENGRGWEIKQAIYADDIMLMAE